MGKVVRPVGFVEVTKAGHQGRQPRDLSTILEALVEDGDQVEILKSDGSRYSSLVTARGVVNLLVPLAEKAGYALTEAWSMEHPSNGVAALCIERAPLKSPRAIRHKPPKMVPVKG